MNSRLGSGSARATGALVVLALLAELCSCARLPPRAAATGLQTAALVSGGSEAARWPQARWWERYGIPELNALVEAALRDAPTVAAAQARVEAATAAAGVAQSDRRLQLTADAQLQRQRLSDNGLLPPRLLGFNWYSPSDLGLTARYDLDLGGRRRAQQRAAAARIATAEAERAAVVLSLGNAVVSGYLGWQADTAGRRLAQQRLEAIEREQQLVRSRTDAQLARADEALQLEQARQLVLEQLAGYDTSLQMGRVAMAALVRQTPATLPAYRAQPLPLPDAELPASASLDLMARRPDLIAARGRVAAALADTDSARAGFIPDIDLRALLGLSSRDLGHLLETASWAPQFAAAVHLPVFDAGKARAQHAGAAAGLRAAVADYNADLVRAAEEVNGALGDRDATAVLLRLRDEQLATAEKLRLLAAQRAEAGLSDARPQLLATRQWLALRESRVQTQYLQLVAELKLIRALGGGYGAGDERQR